MIKAEELRVGNLVAFNEEIIKVDSILPHQSDSRTKMVGMIEVKTPFEYIGRWLEHLTPIPLTPEWLERCGLNADPKEADDYQQWSNLHMTIAQYHDGFYLYSTATDPYHSQSIGKKIEYVHRLQNISLDLFGEELKIEL